MSQLFTNVMIQRTGFKAAEESQHITNVIITTSQAGLISSRTTEMIITDTVQEIKGAKGILVLPSHMINIRIKMNFAKGVEIEKRDLSGNLIPWIERRHGTDKMRNRETGTTAMTTEVEAVVWKALREQTVLHSHTARQRSGTNSK